MDSKTTFAMILTFLAGFSTMIGTIPIFFRRFQEKKIITASLSFASGVMISVTAIDLIPESLTLLSFKYQTMPTFLWMALLIVIGILFSMFIDHYFNEKPVKKQQKLYQIGLISMLAIILHNIPEGIATFMATTSNTKLGISLAIAITLHNIPEGISISVPIYYATKSKKRAFFYTFISGISEPLGAFLAFLFLSPFISNTIMGLLLAFIAGIMLHISIYELLPTSLQYQEKKITILAFLTGILFMSISHFLLG